MNTKAIMNAKAAVVLFSLILAACGGGSSDGGAGGEPEPTEVAPYETHSTNVSGVWSGTTTFFGVAYVMNLTVNQAVSDSAENPSQALTGTFILNGGAPINVTGTKEGDAWSVSGASADVILSTDQTLSSATNSSGTFSLTIVGDVTGTVNLSLTKA